ncbi:MAG: DUF6804 family protein [Limisphaerales bacterium]
MDFALASPDERRTLATMRRPTSDVLGLSVLFSLFLAVFLPPLAVPAQPDETNAVPAVKPPPLVEPKIFEVKGVGTFEFPGSMSWDQIADVLRRGLPTNAATLVPTLGKHDAIVSAPAFGANDPLVEAKPSSSLPPEIVADFIVIGFFSLMMLTVAMTAWASRRVWLPAVRGIAVKLTWGRAARGIGAVLLLLAEGRYPYGYYQLLRWLVCGISVYSFLEALESKERGWVVTFAMLALLFNPVVPVRLTRKTWMLADFVVAALFLFSVPLLRRRTED